MNAVFAAASLFAVSPAWELSSATWQVAPHVKSSGDIAAFAPKVTKPRAAILLPGLYPHPLRPEKALEPELHEWMEPDSHLVTNLGKDMDLYAFGYAQTIPLDGVSLSFGLRVTVQRLRAVGYQEIIMIGHSAGGIIARQFVEHYPREGIAKIIQISAPNYGSDLADLKFGLPRTQVAFIKSIAPGPRTECTHLPIPNGVQFVCVVCKYPRLANDLMVGLDSQWPADLRKQGIPASLVQVNHIDAPKSATSTAVIADLAREPLVRWSPDQTAAAEKIVFGKEADAAAVVPANKRHRPVLKKVGDLIERVVDERMTKP
jgi:pimeloyl-ACP methyl ester carboxylesterase